MQTQRICADDVRHDPLSLMISARGVVSNASRSLRAVGSVCPQEDLEAFGLRGLWEAAVRFDPERGVPFATYATSRVRGAIVDGLRADGSLPRRRGHDGGVNRSPYPVDVDALRPEEPDRLLERAQMLRLIEEVLDHMPHERAEVIRRHFFEGEALSDIARERGRSRSWGSRQLDLALTSLRRQIQEAA